MIWSGSARVSWGLGRGCVCRSQSPGCGGYLPWEDLCAVDQMAARLLLILERDFARESFPCSGIRRILMLNTPGSHPALASERRRGIMFGSGPARRAGKGCNKPQRERELAHTRFNSKSHNRRVPQFSPCTFDSSLVWNFCHCGTAFCHWRNSASPIKCVFIKSLNCSMSFNKEIKLALDISH